MTKPKVLFVEDESFVLEYYRSCTERGSYGEIEGLFAESFAEAKRLIQEHTLTVVITDMVLFDRIEGGFDVVRFVKRHQPRCFVAIVTRYSTVRNVPHWMRAGAFDVLPKPFRRGELAALIQRALELASSTLDRDSLQERLIVEEWDVVTQATTPQRRGASLENLCSLLFNSVEGWGTVETRLRLPREEIDLAIWNETEDSFWRHFGSLFLVECKNWTKKRRPGRPDFDTFFMKLKRRSEADCRLGFFISLNGFAKTFLREVENIADEPQVIVPLDREALWDLVIAPDRSEFLKQRVKKCVVGAIPKTGA